MSHVIISAINAEGYVYVRICRVKEEASSTTANDKGSNQIR